MSSRKEIVESKEDMDKPETPSSETVKVTTREYSQDEQAAVNRALNETKDSIRRSIDEARSELFGDIIYGEHPEKDGWWLTELESLGIHCKKDNSNELNDKQNKINLVECIKQRFIAEYEQVYYSYKKISN